MTVEICQDRDGTRYLKIPLDPGPESDLEIVRFARGVLNAIEARAEAEAHELLLLYSAEPDPPE